jgi:N-dimethylarginine dimethylaminohydrolase
VPDSAASTLDCNILSLGDRHIVARTDGIVAPILRAADYDVTEVDISQFAACGGGIHCLTQPLRRATSSERERSG